ncbi:MAG: bifunctional oligoribonuclease/PAP phosphatase NrnA [Clostridium sp.]
MINNIDNIIDYINGSNYFIVTSHVSPDGDNIGSTLSMYYYLQKIGKKVYYIIDDNFPLNIRFLVENVKILKSSEFNIKDYTLISLDCGDRPRICVSEEIKDNAKKIICIDHHASNNAYGDINYIDSEASSTCELVYNLLIRHDEIYKTNVIDEKVATALYTGLVTDTGNFSYSSTHASSFEMAKELMLLGAKRDMIIQSVFQSNTYNYYKLLGEALNTLEIVDGKISSITLTKDMLKRNAISFNDVDGITPYTRDIEGVEVGILFKEKKENEIKISLRSKNYVDVSEIAKTFGGGGHIRAAGCTINDSIENAKKKVLDAVLKTI